MNLEYQKLTRIDAELFDQTCNSRISRRSLISIDKVKGGVEGDIKSVSSPENDPFHQTSVSPNRELYVGQKQQILELKTVLTSEFEKVRVLAVNSGANKILKRCEVIGMDLPGVNQYERNVVDYLKEFEENNMKSSFSLKKLFSELVDLGESINFPNFTVSRFHVDTTSSVFLSVLVRATAKQQQVADMVVNRCKVRQRGIIKECEGIIEKLNEVVGSKDLKVLAGGLRYRMVFKVFNPSNRIFCRFFADFLFFKNKS